MVERRSEYSQGAFHAALALHNLARIVPSFPTESWVAAERSDLAWRLREGYFLESLRAEITPLVQDIPSTPDEFVTWFESLQDSGPGQGDTLFSWLADEATPSQLRWFLTQEVAGEAGFDDLLATTQVKLPLQAKLECARNFWDEMGYGKAKAMHGPMLENMVLELNLQPKIDSTVWQSLALSNAMLGMALTRRYAFHSIGALCVIELTAPGRATQVVAAMRRTGMSARACAYFDLHAALDLSHSRCWNKEIIYSLVQANPRHAVPIAEGALMRLRSGERCFKRYRQEFGLDKRPSPARQALMASENSRC